MKKKIYKKGTVHPSPPIISDHLSFLPATLLTLTAALSPEDREVLAYLISCSANHNLSFSSSSASSSANNNNNQRKPTSNTGQRNSLYGGGSSKLDYSMRIDGSGKDHPTLFNCECFRCYMSYWVRWDSSPNRHLIHEIIDSFEDQLLQSSASNSNVKRNKKGNRNKNNNKKGVVNKSLDDDDGDQLKSSDQLSFKDNVSTDSSLGLFGEDSSQSSSTSDDADTGEVVEDGCDDKGSLRRLVGSIGERIWGVFA